MLTNTTYTPLLTTTTLLMFTNYRPPPSLPLPALPAGLIAHPNQVNIKLKLVKNISDIQEASRKKNTAIAYDAKKAEFLQFCETEYGGSTMTQYHLNSDKVYKFMYYQAF